MDKDGKPGYALVSIASKEQRYVPLECTFFVALCSLLFVVRHTSYILFV